MDKKKALEVRERIIKSLKSLPSDIHVDVGRINYRSNGCFSIRIEGTVGTGLSKPELDYDNISNLMGLPRRGTKFTVGNKTFIIVGYNSRARKNCIKIKDLDGQDYTTTIDAIREINK